MVCGNFREGICKTISLEDVEAGQFSKLLHLSCGDKRFRVESIEDMLELGELAERLQMEAVRKHLEDLLLDELSEENCVEIIRRSEASGLKRLQEGCYNTLRNRFEIICQQDEFMKLSEEMMDDLLEEDELNVSREEVVFEALLRWMTRSGARSAEQRLLTKIRYGLISDKYLRAHMTVTVLGQKLLQELVGETIAQKGGGSIDSAKKGGGSIASAWDGVGRLGRKWVIPRGMKGRIIGADVLKNPRFVAIDRQKRILVGDGDLHQIVIFNHDGSIAQRIGSEGVACGQLSWPTGVAVDREGHIIVTDRWNHLIQVLNANGSVVRHLGSEGAAVGQLKAPFGVATDREGNIVVAECGNDRIQVFDAEGSVVRHFGSIGAAVGQLDGPAGVAVDGQGRIVVADQCNHRVQVFNSDDSVALCFGSEGDGPGQLRFPCGVALDSLGRFVVADRRNDRVQVFNTDGSVARVIGGSAGGTAKLGDPSGVLVDEADRIFVVEGGPNHRVQVV